jgi:hypothetical protein
MPKRKKTKEQPYHRQLAKTLTRKRGDAMADSDKFAGTEDEEHVASLPDKLSRQTLDAFIIEQQRKKGKEARRPAKVAPETLLAAVKAMHLTDRKNHGGQITRTFSDVCRDVAVKFGYKPSATSVKQAAGKIKWPDPRRRHT